MLPKLKKNPLGLSISPIKTSILPTPPAESSKFSSLLNLEDKYEIGDRLGDESSFKLAYKAIKNGKPFVLFTFKDPVAGNKEIKTFKKLIKSSTCSTNAICPVEIGYYKGAISIVTEFIEGITLDTFMDIIDGEDYNMYNKKINIKLPENPEKVDIMLSYGDSIRLMKKIIKSLLFIHNSWNFVHLDIKPDNIMINSDLSSVYIIDLGSGCFGDKEDNCEERNATERYGAPENITSELYVENDYWSKNGNFENWKAADIYSVGRIFEDLLKVTKFCNTKQINELENLINEMTNEDYKKRPKSEIILTALNNLETIGCEENIQSIGESFFNRNLRF